MSSGQEVLDPVTGFLNRASLSSRFAELSQQARLTHQPVCLALCELDRFGFVSDGGGGDICDGVVAAIAAQTRRQLRPFELIYLLSEGRFVLVLPGVEVDDGVALTERLRSAVEQHSPKGVPVTMSGGVGAGRGHRVRRDTLLRAAEGALFAAQRTGGNRVLAAPRDGIGPHLAEFSQRDVERCAPHSRTPGTPA